MCMHARRLWMTGQSELLMQKGPDERKAIIEQALPSLGAQNVKVACLEWNGCVQRDRRSSESTVFEVWVWGDAAWLRTASPDPKSIKRSMPVANATRSSSSWRKRLVQLQCQSLAIVKPVSVLMGFLLCAVFCDILCQR